MRGLGEVTDQNMITVPVSRRRDFRRRGDTLFPGFYLSTSTSTSRAPPSLSAQHALIDYLLEMPQAR